MTQTNASTTPATVQGYQSAGISSHYAGFGMYQAGEYNGNIYADPSDIYSDCEWYQDGDTSAPAEAQAVIDEVKGSCHNEPQMLVAVWSNEAGEDMTGGWVVEGVSASDCYELSSGEYVTVTNYNSDPERYTLA